MIKWYWWLTLSVGAVVAMVVAAVDHNVAEGIMGGYAAGVCCVVWQERFIARIIKRATQ
jgi:hypothetical protein